MEKQRASKPFFDLDDIVNFSNDARAALMGLEYLHGQGETLVAKIMDGKKTEEELYEIQKDLFTWFDLMKITIKAGLDNVGFIQEALFERQKDFITGLSVVK